MKFEDIANRMDLRRESERGYTYPWDSFQDRIVSARELVVFVEENTTDIKLRLEARKYLVLVCVSAMETFFGNVVRDFVDNDWIASGFFNYKKVKNLAFTLGDLYERDKKQISIGEIIAITQSFQNLDNINGIFSSMFGVKDFISDVESFDMGKEYSHNTLKDVWPNYRQYIEDMIRFRHIIVHHEGIRRLGLRRTISMYNALFRFIYAAHECILDKVPPEDRE